MTDVGPRVAALQQVFAARYPIFREAVPRAAATFGPEWAAEAEELLDRLFPDDEALGRAVEGYATFALDTMRRERRFETERTYPAKTFAEAAAEVYLDDAYMTGCYLPGLLLSHLLWPHHVRQARHFAAGFLAELRAAGTTELAEVGCGTGIYSRRALAALPELRAHGYDLSPSSADFSAAHVTAYGFSDRYATSVRDVLAAPIAPVQALVCVEVLEHLEDPTVLLAGLRAALAPGGLGFVTAAVNAPNVDHIHLYRSAAEVEEQLVAAGFVVDQAFAATAYAPRSPGLPVPTVAAYVVR